MRILAKFFAFLLMLAIVSAGALWGGYKYFWVPENLASPILVRLENRYRLKPDMRMLAALGEIDAFFTGRAPGAVTVVSRPAVRDVMYGNKKLGVLSETSGIDDYYMLLKQAFTAIARDPYHKIKTAEYQEGWSVSYGATPVGTLPEMPSFQDYIALLEQWALARGATRGAAMTEEQKALYRSQNYDPQKLFQELAEAGQAWQSGKRDPALLINSAKNYAILRLQADDAMAHFDELTARPMAFLVLSRLMTGYDHSREEALLAFGAGYGAHALALVQKMPAQTPVRLYIESNWKALAAQAAQPAAGAETLYFAMASLAREHVKHELYSLIGRNLGDAQLMLLAMKAVIRQADFGPMRAGFPAMQRLFLQSMVNPDGFENRQAFNMQMGNLLHAAIFAADSSAVGPIQSADMANLENVLQTHGQRSYRADDFEQALDQTTQKNAKGFVSPAYYQSFWRSSYYASLYYEAGFDLNTLGSIEATEALHKHILNEHTPLVQAFAAWLASMLSVDAGQLSSQEEIESGLTAAARIGHQPTLDLYRRHIRTFGFGEKPLYDVTAILAGILDGRPDNLFEFSSVMWENVYDLNRLEDLQQAAMRATGDTNKGVRISNALFSNRSITDMVGPDTVLSGSSFRFLLENMRKDALPDGQSAKLFATFLLRDPGDGNVIDAYLDYLLAKKDYANVVAYGEAWLKRDGVKDAFCALCVQRKVALGYFNQGDYRKSYEILAPLLPSYHGGVLGDMAMTLQKLGYNAEAGRLLARARERYPNALHLIKKQMQILWRQKQYREAAENFRLMVSISFANEDFQDAARDFIDIFGKNLDEGRTAMQAIYRAGIDPERQNHLMNEIRHGGDARLAFALRKELIDQLTPEGACRLMFPVVDGILDVRRAKGDQRAVAWGRAMFRDLINRSSVALYEVREYGLLWDLIGEPNGADGPEFVWLLRAAAHARAHGTDGHRQQLLDHYAQIQGGDYYVVLGRYLMGLANLDEVLAHIKDDKSLGEIAYYVAVKAMGERNYRQAVKWLMVTIDVNRRQDREYAWANQQLYMWYSKARFPNYLPDDPPSADGP